MITSVSRPAISRSGVRTMQGRSLVHREQAQAPPARPSHTEMAELRRPQSSNVKLTPDLVLPLISRRTLLSNRPQFITCQLHRSQLPSKALLVPITLHRAKSFAIRNVALHPFWFSRLYHSTRCGFRSWWTSCLFVHDLYLNPLSDPKSSKSISNRRILSALHP